MVDKQPTKDSKCPHCVPHGTKLWLRIGCDCKTCNGTGKVTESKPDESQEDLGLFKYDSDTGWYECPRCHYSQIRLVGFCMKCGYDVFKPSKGNLDNSKELPMGVTEWKQHGIKYGYWDYFKEASEQEKANEEIIKSMKSSKADNTNPIDPFDVGDERYCFACAKPLKQHPAGIDELVCSSCERPPMACPCDLQHKQHSHEGYFSLSCIACQDLVESKMAKETFSRESTDEAKN